jgi:hypothetical protein
VSDPLLQSALRELHALLIRPRIWLVFALVVALFVLTGPFGTYERLAFPTRLGYWLVLHAVTWACALASIALFDTALNRRIPSRLARMLAGAVFSALPVGFAITVINFVLLMRPLNLQRIFENMLVAIPIAIAFCLLTWLSMTSGNGAIADDGPRPDADPAQLPADAEEKASIGNGTGAPAPRDRPALLDRLPVDKRGALIRLEVQDHYTLVVTTRGTELLLMRLGDAIAETGPETGQQIHRSHWVSDAGVSAVIRDGGRNPRLTVRTTDGQALPVSRSQMPEVRARWGGRITST